MILLVYLEIEKNICVHASLLSLLLTLLTIVKVVTSGEKKST